MRWAEMGWDGLGGDVSLPACAHRFPPVLAATVIHPDATPCRGSVLHIEAVALGGGDVSAHAHELSRVARREARARRAVAHRFLELQLADRAEGRRPAHSGASGALAGATAARRAGPAGEEVAARVRRVVPRLEVAQHQAVFELVREVVASREACTQGLAGHGACERRIVDAHVLEPERRIARAGVVGDGDHWRERTIAVTATKVRVRHDAFRGIPGGSGRSRRRRALGAIRLDENTTAALGALLRSDRGGGRCGAQGHEEEHRRHKQTGVHSCPRWPYRVAQCRA
jgi:hypothetical protein